MKRIKIGNAQKMGVGNESESYILQTQIKFTVINILFQFFKSTGTVGWLQRNILWLRCLRQQLAMLGVTVAIAARKVKGLTSLKYSSLSGTYWAKEKNFDLDISDSSQIVKGVNLSFFFLFGQCHNTVQLIAVNIFYMALSLLSSALITLKKPNLSFLI